MRFQPASFRPAFGRVLTITIALIALGALIGFVVADDVAGLLRSGWWLLLLAAVTWALYWKPAVEVLEHEVTVRNPLSTWHVPWPAIERIDTKWALTLYTPRGRIEAWAAPASGRYTVFTLGPEDTRVSETARLAGSIRPGDTLSSESGAAANQIRRHWEQLRDDGLLDVPLEPGSLRRTPNTRTIAVLSVLVALSLLGLVL
ncbi:PH domain-containing protein [Microcella sp.]|uniref:PH domain-containing protein n=1 Tax=Microcella sp. TaxID=1913979 RepID=UPI003F710B50